MVALRTRRSGPVPGWNATPNGAVSRLFEAYGMTPMQASAGRAGRGPRPRGRAPKNMESTTMQSAAKSSRMARRSRYWPGQRADEDPAQVVLDAPHAALGRRLALGVGHHQVVGVVRRGEGHEAGARRLDLFAVVRRREEHDVVTFGDQPAGQCDQRRRMTLGRRGAQDEAPRTVAAAAAAPRPPCRRRDDAPPQGGSASAPSTLDPSSSCVGAHGHRPGHAAEGHRLAADMLSSTVAPSPRE